MTKNWKLVLGGRPSTLTSMSSTGPMGLIVTLPLASGRQVFAPAETTMSKVVEFFGEAAISADASSNSPSPTGAASKKCNLRNIVISPFRGTDPTNIEWHRPTRAVGDRATTHRTCHPKKL